MTDLVDWSFIITLAVIVLATLIGAYMRSAHRDRCLTDFDGYHVTVEKKNNQVIWGNMALKATGLELIYRADVQDDGHMETSYILYKDEYDDLQAIYRYARDLTEDLQQERARSVEKSLHPGIVRRARRSMRNFLSTATDSMAEAFTLALGRVRRKGAALMNDTSQSYIRGIGKDIIGYVGTSYDPLLERFVGTRVVAEIVEDDEVHEHVGMLKEYSADFLELLDVYYPLPQEVNLTGRTDYEIAEKVVITRKSDQVHVKNMADQPQYLGRIVLCEQETQLNAILGGGEEIVLPIDPACKEVTLYLRIALRLDMIVPRSHALIRHRAERYNPDSIFDVGMALVRRDTEQREVEQLRQSLRYAPDDAITAAKLGECLMRSGEFVEARRWLLEAQQRSYRLPDRGARVGQNLRRAERMIEQMRLQQRLEQETRMVSLNGLGKDALQTDSFEI